MNLDNISLNWGLVLAGFVLIITELLIGVDMGFDLVIMGLAFVGGGLVGNYLGDFWWGIGSATVLIFLYVILGRRTIKSKLSISTHKTNIDSLIGKVGFVAVEIAPHKKGRVTIGGELWLAEAENKIAEKESIIVESIEGVTLKVRRNGGEK